MFDIQELRIWKVHNKAYYEFMKKQDILNEKRHNSVPSLYLPDAELILNTELTEYYKNVKKRSETPRSNKNDPITLDEDTDRINENDFNEINE